MAGKRALKLISFIVIAFTIFQLIPAELLSPLESGAGQPISGTLAFSDSNHNDILYIAGSSHKFSIPKVQVRNISSGICNLSASISALNNSTLQGYSIDHRKTIRQLIPQHFYGSKYQGGHPAI